jgi:hypothetical protein
MKTPRVLTWALAIVVSYGPALVNAATSTNYGDMVGVTMKYLDITETAQSAGDSVPLYGPPRLSGDSLIFSHMTFVSQANNGATDITDGKLDTDIQSKNNPGYYIGHLILQEFGDTTLSGTGTSATRSSAGTSVFITVLETNNWALDFPVFITTNLSISDGGQWTLPPPITGKTWTGYLDLDLTAALLGYGIEDQVTLLHLTADNTLTTSSEDSTSAYIAKKAEGLSVTAIIPEPSTLSLLVLGGTFLVLRPFRRKN